MNLQFTLLFLLLTLTPSLVLAQRPPFGPFAARDQFPVKLVFLSLRPDGAALLPQHTWRLSGRIAYSNTYAVTRPIGDPRIPLDYYQDAPLDEYRLFVDTETLRLDLNLDWQAVRWAQVGVEIPLIAQGGGFLDGAVEGFHNLFNLSNGGREETRRNAYGIYVARSARFWMARDNGRFLRLSDIVLRVKSPVLTERDGGAAVSWGGAVKLPTGDFDALTGSGGTDMQLALYVSRTLRRFALHYNVAYTWTGKPSRHTGFPTRNITSHLLAVEFLATDRLSVVTQFLGNTSIFPASRLGPLDRAGYEVNAGVKYALTSSSVFEIGLIENLSQYQNTPDIALHVGWSVRR